MSVSLIAAKAGVSIATVSRVLNNSRPVNPKLAELVHNAVKELQITPKPARKRIRSRSTNKQLTVAIVTLGSPYREWFEVPVIAGVVGELTAAAQDRNMSILMAEMPDPKQLSNVLRRPDISGAFAFLQAGLSQSDLATLRAQLPIVRVMGGDAEPTPIDHVCPDNIAIGALACQYLLDHGLKELAFFTHSQGWNMIAMRAEGFALAARKAGITPLICHVGDGTEVLPIGGTNVIAAPAINDVISQLAQRRHGKLGLFVSRDIETVDVYRALATAKLRVGEDVIVISCDNENARLSSLHPRPASIDLNPSLIARHAVARLAERIERPDDAPIRIGVQPKVIPGDIDRS